MIISIFQKLIYFKITIPPFSTDRDLLLYYVSMYIDNNNILVKPILYNYINYYYKKELIFCSYLIKSKFTS